MRKEGDNGSSYVGVESFADFVARELVSGTSNSVYEKLRRAAQDYICGEDDAADRVGEVYQLLFDEGVRVSYRVDNSNNTVDNGIEEFGQDLLECFTELLYEYLSRNWDKMDELIKVNSSLTQEKEEEGVESRALYNWDNMKTKLYRKKVEGHLSVPRTFMTMSVILKSVSASKDLNGSSLSLSQPPTIVFLGGGMGAGKSTVVSLLKEQNEGIFNQNPVFIEADALKMIDPVFQALNKRENGANEVSYVVHEHSTDAANRHLLSALRNQRNIVMDGTMTWMPYVQQTVAMVQDAHRHNYRLSPGYSVAEDGTVTEKYWEAAEPADKITEDFRPVQPYHIEMIGVTVDPDKAVARALRRKLITGRGVPTRGQLRSHRLFTENFESYLGLMEKTMLFDTGGSGQPQKVAMKERGQPLWQESSSYQRFLRKKHINDDANGVGNLYLDDGAAIEFHRKGIKKRIKDTFLVAKTSNEKLEGAHEYSKVKQNRTSILMRDSFLLDRQTCVLDSLRLEDLFTNEESLS